MYNKPRVVTCAPEYDCTDCDTGSVAIFGYFCLTLYVRIYCTKCLFMATKYFKFGKHFINKRLPKGNFETMVSHCILYCKVNRPIALRGHVTNASFNNNLES